MSISAVGGLRRAEAYRGVAGPLYRLEANAECLSFVPRWPLHRALPSHSVKRRSVRWIAAARHFPEYGLVVMLTNGNRWVFGTRADIRVLMNELGALGYTVAEEA